MDIGSRTLLVIGHLWPQPNVSAAGSRLLQLLNSFKKAGYTLYFGSDAEPNPHSEDLTALEIQCVSMPLNRQEASIVIRELQPDVVLFDRFMTEEQFAWRVQDEAPNALRILNTEDLHSLRKARRLAFEEGVECDLAFWLQQEITLRELASILRSDLSLIISETECDWLADTGIVSQEIYFYLPFMLNKLKSIKSSSYNDFYERLDFCFTGYGRHAPNADAVRFLIRSIWPLIRMEIPEAKLHVFGKEYPTDILSFNNPEQGIFIKGWVEDLGTALANTRVNLAPLRFGAGLKGKIVHAFQWGTPAITTTVGAEGLFTSEEFDTLIADDPKEIARKAVQLYQNESLWQKSVEIGRAHLEKEMDQKLHHDRLHKKIEAMLQGLEAHRSRHVLGRILRHQSHQSTYYMAKWIEEKNRP